MASGSTHFYRLCERQWREAIQYFYCHYHCRIAVHHTELLFKHWVAASASPSRNDKLRDDNEN
ncbi:hypothetical protein [uncultured Nitrosomonas sp.]|uniref:hypothetical protein n=1 Tax=uncultured Nitrosomonas sp. TaxID=156424 RepID=UPI002630E43C|nr:hypothetical protein [uncultured Nitrosomonas sp.]